jgi:hypothetical protein
MEGTKPFGKAILDIAALSGLVIGFVACYESGRTRLDARDDPAGEAADFPAETADVPVEPADPPMEVPDLPAEVLDLPVESIDPPVDPAEPELSGICPGGIYVPEEIPSDSSLEVDILVVVDNSGSMAAEQALLVEAFPTLIRSLLTGLDDEGTRIHPPVRDLHLGVVSTNMGSGGYGDGPCVSVGDDGVLQHAPRRSSCEIDYPLYLSYEIGPYAEPEESEVDRLTEDFGCIALLGVHGCGYEQALEAATKALTVHSEPGGANAGFLRPRSILAVLFITDENDCSAADPELFDESDIDYSSNLLCLYRASMLQPVERYATTLRRLRADPEDLVLGFIVGVPQDAASCNGRGDEIAGCLDHPAMQETVGPHSEVVDYACTYPSGCESHTCTSEASPGTRYVRLAQSLGNNAVVQSICAESFIPAMVALTGKLQEAISSKSFYRPLGVTRDPASPCRCLADCSMIELLSDARACRDADLDGAPDVYDADGDTVGDIRIDEATGRPRSMCVVPQAGSIPSDCSLPCEDPAVVLSKDPSRDGWWYDHSHDTNGDTVRDYTIHFEGVVPEGGSDIVVECCL